MISASSTIIEERNIALNGDMAWCPLETCNGPFQINGTAYHFAEDKACVATGDRVLCNCKNNQVLGSTTLWVEDSPGDHFEEHRKRAAEWPITKMAAAAAAITAIPVFAKSVLRKNSGRTTSQHWRNEFLSVQTIAASPRARTARTGRKEENSTAARATEEKITV